jgi:hypothetical protein
MWYVWGQEWKIYGDNDILLFGKRAKIPKTFFLKSEIKTGGKRDFNYLSTTVEWK